MPQTILDINYLVNILEKTFYTLPIMVLLNVLFLVLALWYKPKERKYKIFVLYGAAALLQDMLCIFLMLANKTLIKDPNTIVLIDECSITCFTQLEFALFYTFFYAQFNNSRIKHAISLTGKAFVLTTILISIYTILFASSSVIKKFEGYISVTSSFLLLIPAIYYFYTLFAEPPIKNLLREPSFWITTGIVFLHGINIPLFFAESYLLKEFTAVWYNLYSINYIAYCFLFILLIISLLCKTGKKKTKNEFMYSLYLL
jgi:hypothetical protein